MTDRIKHRVPYLGERLKGARESVGLSREQVAVDVGRSWAAVRSYELGVASPPLDVLLDLADLYGVTAGDLLDLR